LVAAALAAPISQKELLDHPAYFQLFHPMAVVVVRLEFPVKTVLMAALAAAAQALVKQMERRTMQVTAMTAVRRPAA
jgi:hypothetical protein